MCLISNADPLPILLLILTDVAEPDIQPDPTNEKESDDSDLILEKKVGSSLYITSISIGDTGKIISGCDEIQPCYCSNSSVGKIQKKSQTISP